jgi:hypothetical protein
LSARPGTLADRPLSQGCRLPREGVLDDGIIDVVDAPSGGIGLPEWVCRETPFVEEASMAEVSMIGLDLAKNTFQAHGENADGSVAFR